MTVKTIQDAKWEVSFHKDFAFEWFITTEDNIGVFTPFTFNQGSFTSSFNRGRSSFNRGSFTSKDKAKADWESFAKLNKINNWEYA